VVVGASDGSTHSRATSSRLIVVYADAGVAGYVHFNICPLQAHVTRAHEAR